MKPPPFDYAAPESLAEAVDALSQPGAVVLAGGQSLVLELVYRQRRPRLLVDINGLTELDELLETADGLSIGALVRHRRLEREPGESPARRLFRQIAPYVGHPPIRRRGTFCGSVAWAHPAAEWNALAVACEAEMQLRSASGSRAVPSSDFFLGDRLTARRPDELLTAVQLRPVPPGTGVGFGEHRRTHAGFADVAVVALVTVADGLVQRARIAVAGVADRPLRLTEVEEAMEGVPAGSAAGWTRQAVAAADGLGHDHQRAVAAELAGRSVAQAVSA